MNPMTRARWSPYLAGGLIGVLSWAAFAFADQPLGLSSAFVQAVGLAEKAVAPGHVAASPLFSKSPPKIGWEWTLLLGVFLGAWISARMGGTREVDVPSGGATPRFGAVGAFAGGLLLLLGARIAGGCTSGHAVSGGLQLALSSWVFLGAFFAAGVATAALLYRPGGRHV